MESDQSKAVSELLNMIFGSIKLLSLRCAVDLGIPDMINSHSQPMTLNQLHSALSLPPTTKSYLRRLMRMLTHLGFITTQCDATIDAENVTYDLTPTSRLVTSNNIQGSVNLLPFLLFQIEAFSSVSLNAFLHMGEWFKQEDKQIPFEIAYGCGFWEMTGQNSNLNEMFNSAMVGTCSYFTDMIIKNGGDIFKGVESLVDVGGGTGSMAKAISSNFPHVKCMVLDLPQVIGDISNDGIVKFLPGDMFDYIPPANAVVLQWILHCWSDEDCIKILKLCKTAISSIEHNGKVIIMEAVVRSANSSTTTTSTETQLMFDMLMMATTGGIERDEHEWESLFKQAGFSSYNIKKTSGFVSIIEVYP